MKHRWTKNAFWDVNNKKCRKWCKIVTPILFNHSYGLPVITMDTKCPNQVYVRLVDLETIVAKYGLESWFPPDVDICKYLLYMKHGSIKTRFETWLTRNDVNGNWFTFLIYLSSHCERNDQIKYFMFDWSIYRLFALNRCRKHESFQIMIFVNVCWTWGIVQINTSFETWITGNDINGLSLVNFLI
jgi:hypothetical protein